MSEGQVILDVGGMDIPLSDELLQCVDILSPNEVSISLFLARPSCEEWLITSPSKESMA